MPRLDPLGFDQSDLRMGLALKWLSEPVVVAEVFRETRRVLTRRFKVSD